MNSLLVFDKFDKILVRRIPPFIKKAEVSSRTKVKGRIGFLSSCANIITEKVRIVIITNISTGLVFTLISFFRGSV
jgi:hypothetical protein